MSTPRERPIRFSGPMVRALLEGRKTMTRRTRGLDDLNAYDGRLTGEGAMGPLGYLGLAPSPMFIGPKDDYRRNPGLYHMVMGQRDDPAEINPIPLKCPFGAVGDRLWVREKTRRIGGSFNNGAIQVRYEADGKEAYVEWPERLKGYPEVGACLAYGCHREASRLTLEITGVRVERLQDISHEDALAEGVADEDHHHPFPVTSYAVGNYRELWSKINGCASWVANPWVWVIEFRRLEATR